MAQLFNFIPGAGLIAPGVFFEQNSGGQFESKSRAVVMGYKSAAGSLSDSALTLCSTIEEAAQLAGVGSQLYEKFRVARRHAPVQEFWVSSIPVTGTAAAWTLTLSALAASGGDGVLEIAGRSIQVSAGASEAVEDSAANLAAAINAYVDPLTLAYLPVTAAVADEVITLTARHAGAAMNEIEIAVDSGLPGNLYAGKIVIASTVTGSGTPAIAATLAALGDEPFHWLVSPFADTTSMAAAEAALSDLSGRWGWNNQLYGHYFTVNTGNTGANTTFGLARNSRHVSTLARVAAPTPSWEMIGAYAARQLPWLSDDTNGNAARNMSDLPLEGVRPPRDRSLWPNYTVRNTLLGAGMSTWSVNGAGQVVIDKCITMRRQNDAGQPDTVFRNVQSIALSMHFLRYMRAGLSYRLANRAYAPSNPGNLPTIVTNDDIKADCIALHGDLVNRGIAVNTPEFARRLRVETDASNPARCNIGMDSDFVDPLDIIATNLTTYGQYPLAA